MFYVGDKYKLIDEIKQYFPQHVRQFVEPFVGGGSVFLNTEADRYVLNDIDRAVITLHHFLQSQARREPEFFQQILSTIKSRGLSCSYHIDSIPPALKTEYPKTYFAHYNREAFLRLRSDYNTASERPALWLYILLIYGFNHMLRFNARGEYNLPVGNVDFNQNTYDALHTYFREVQRRDIVWHNNDFRQFLDNTELGSDDLVYLDPPYLITFSEYNKLWSDTEETALLHMLDDLDRRGIRFAISNVTHYKGRTNNTFLNWSQHYNCHSIKSNYICFRDNTNKQFNEVLVTNY